MNRCRQPEHSAGCSDDDEDIRAVGMVSKIMGLVGLGTVLVLMLGKSACAERRGTLGLFGNASPDVLYSVTTDQPVVALTIDDGPDPRTTPRLLELLARHDAKATFFVISDHIPGNEDILRRIMAAGHEIGNHMTRDEKSIDLPPEVFERELLKADAILSEYTKPRWFRPGSGWYDRIMLDILARNGYRCVLGNVYPLDAQFPWSWIARQVILALAEPGDIIILHEGKGRGERTLKTLSAVLPAFRKAGLRVVTLTELESAAISLNRKKRKQDTAPPWWQQGNR